ncbi:disulfide bond formation protein B [Pelomonas sp. SE-A7]|uniref:disulfide bond formation protein B n=1 Tax=Pelomonas sp. SE-A7 TaxID=3054953 RepID=UPI00259C7476|nr:disulfide bond formation protein B [Pelomonas sp. SE-A7]MDM4765674.1 disulfide bond formation protein B [Pelomonas sp. SE-A7]
MLNLKPARALALICLLSFAGVAAALVAQHGYKVRPCPWCVMQRLIFIVIGVVAGLGWMAQRWKPARLATLGLVLVLGIAGLASAWYQHDVASQLASCNLTLADRVMTGLGLNELWPKVFMVTASCAEAAAYRLLGLPYEIWSGALYLLLMALAVLGLKSGDKR